VITSTFRYLGNFVVGAFVLQTLSGCALLPRFARPAPIHLEVRIAPEDRSAHYSRKEWMPDGHWLKRDGCRTTRSVVLQRDSRIPVSWTSTGCSVDSGLWISPYTGDSLRSATELDIDHVVPLAEASRSGGSSWDSARKIAYANFLDDSTHLLSVDLASNRIKSDDDPPRWMPSRAEFTCAYLAAWTRVKARWDLAMDSTEFVFVEHGLDSCDRAGALVPPVVLGTSP